MGRGTTVISLAALQLQSLALLDSISLPWPEGWSKVMRFVALANLDPTRFFDTTGLPPVTFHTLYILFVNCLPILIALSGLLIFQPLRFVIWYACLAASLVVLGLGIAMLNGLSDALDNSAAWWYIAVGGTVAFICIVVGIAAYFVLHMDDDDKEEADEEIRRKHEAARRTALQFNGLRSARLFLTAAGCFVGGCALTGLFVTIPGTSRQAGFLGAFGFALFVICVLNLLYGFASLSAGGRKKVVKIETFLKANALLALLLLISVTYVPTIDYCVASYMCASYKCPAGSVFNPRAPRPEAERFSRSSSIFCDPCEFRDARCRADGGWLYTTGQAPTLSPAPTTSSANASTVAPTVTAALASYNRTVEEYCPAYASNRVWKFPDVPCDDPSLKYFFVSSAIVLFCYIVLVPILYVRLIIMITDVLHKKAVLIPKDVDDNIEYLPPNKVYDRQVYAVEPAAASLYQPFVLQHRYFTLVLLAFRLVLVAFSGVVAPWVADVALYLLLATHIVAIVALLYTLPFNESIEQNFAVSLECCSVVNVGLALAIFYSWTPPDWMVYILLLTNVFIPIVAAVLTFRFVRNRVRKRKQEHHNDNLQQSMSMVDQEMLDLTGPMLQPPPHGGGDDSPPLSPRSKAKAQAGAKYLTLSQQVKKTGLKGVTIPKAVMPTPREEEEINEENEQLKASLNLKTADMVTTYFAALGMLLLAAGLAALLGYMQGTHTDFPDGSTYAERGPMPVIAGYSSFADMTDNCCCIESRNPAEVFNTTERWICPGKGVVVDRGRKDFDGENNGLPIRPVCGGPLQLRLGCQITVNETSNGESVMLTCPDFITEAQWTALQVSQKARDLYF